MISANRVAKIPAGLFFLALLCSPSLAAAQGKQAQVEELFQLMRMEQTYAKMMDTVMKQTKSSVMQQVLGRQVPPGLEADIEQLQNEVGDILMRYMGWNALKSDYVRLYAEAFSEQELTAILAFYRTPAGQALIERQPLLMDRSSEVVQRKMVEAGPAVQAKMAEWAERIRARQAPRQ